MWTEPEHLMLWWGPRGFTTISGRLDVRPGGKLVGVVDVDVANEARQLVAIGRATYATAA